MAESRPLFIRLTLPEGLEEALEGLARYGLCISLSFDLSFSLYLPIYLPKYLSIYPSKYIYIYLSIYHPPRASHLPEGLEEALEGLARYGLCIALSFYLSLALFLLSISL